MPNHQTQGPSLTEILEKPLEEKRTLLLNWNPRIREWQEWLETQEVKYRKANPRGYWPPGDRAVD